MKTQLQPTYTIEIRETGYWASQARQIKVHLFENGYSSLEYLPTKHKSPAGARAEAKRLWGLYDGELGDAVIEENLMEGGAK